jgi:hypothetical protein
MKSACEGLSSNLEVGDLAAQTEVDVETMVTQHLNDKDMATSPKNGKLNHEPGASNTGSNSENKSDDSCEGVPPKLSRQKILMK